MQLCIRIPFKQRLLYSHLHFFSCIAICGYDESTYRTVKTVLVVSNFLEQDINSSTDLERAQVEISCEIYRCDNESWYWVRRCNDEAAYFGAGVLKRTLLQHGTPVLNLVLMYRIYTFHNKIPPQRVPASIILYGIQPSPEYIWLSEPRVLGELWCNSGDRPNVVFLAAYVAQKVCLKPSVGGTKDKKILNDRFSQIFSILPDGHFPASMPKKGRDLLAAQHVGNVIRKSLWNGLVPLPKDLGRRSNKKFYIFSWTPVGKD